MALKASERVLLGATYIRGATALALCAAERVHARGPVVTVHTAGATAMVRKRYRPGALEGACTISRIWSISSAGPHFKGAKAFVNTSAACLSVAMCSTCTSSEEVASWRLERLIL